MIDESEAYLLAIGLLEGTVDEDEREAAIAICLASESHEVRAVGERAKGGRRE